MDHSVEQDVIERQHREHVLLNLAREAIKLSNSPCLVLKIFSNAGEIIKELDAINPNQDTGSRQVWLREHPISQLLAHKIKITVCESPDESYRRAERQVEAIINASNVNQESMDKASEQCPRDPYHGAISNSAELQRVKSASKRLRR